MVAEIEGKVRPSRRMRGRVVGDLKHMSRRRTRCHRVRVVTRVRDERVIRVRRIDSNPAYKPRRPQVGATGWATGFVDAVERHGGGFPRVGSGWAKNASAPQSCPEGTGVSCVPPPRAHVNRMYTC